MSLLRIHPLCFSAVLVLGCTGAGEDSGELAGPVDVDGDGYSEDEDCDDSDSSIYPGAEDTWYDDVDSDCGLDDDHDADGDGIRAEMSGGADCDDSDPGISPLATEIWYDGVDQDCRGDNDYDQDLDGFEAEGKIKSGQDCDDLDGAVFPGATDEWYDGVDSNCDGASDYDADGDSHDSAAEGMGDDCDDWDDATFPGAEEVWYDGTDGDCAGDDDYDADGDGHLADSEGGDDCNDMDPEAYPGTLEQLDGYDTDCDGASDHYGIEEDFGGTYILGSSIGDGFGSLVVVGDLDADGLDDLVVLQDFDDGRSAGGNGLISVGLGSSLSSTPTVSSSLDFVLLTTFSSGSLDSLAVLDDLNGDGGQEILAGSSSASAGDGGAWLATGSDLAASVSPTLSEASWSFLGSGDGYGRSVAGAGDLDGDGLSEVLVAAPDDSGKIYLYSSATLASSGLLAASDSDAIWMGGQEDGALGTSMAALSDLDGDGLADLALGAPGDADAAGMVYLVYGSVVPESGSVVNIAFASLDGDSAGDEAGSTLSVGDLDGDGVPDLVVGAPLQVTQSGRIHVVSGLDMVEGSQTLEDAAFVSYTGPTVFGHAGMAIDATGDVDGDGRDDLLVGGPGDSTGGGDAGAAWLVISNWSGPRALADADASFWGGSREDYTGYGVGLGDMNGDSLDDLIIGVPGEDSLSDEGAVYIGYSGY